MTYRSEIILEINEASMENMMCGPTVELSFDKQMIFGQKIGRFNTQGYKKYHYLIEEHKIDNLEISEPGIFDEKDGYFFSPQFELIKKPENIITLHIDGYGKFDPKYDRNSFSFFSNLKCLITDSISLNIELSNFFPKLEAWLNFDWKSNPVKELGDSWPELKYLHIQGFKGSLSIFEGRDLQRLFLVYPSLKTLEELTLFPNLNTVYISGLRKGLDLSPISKLKKLENLCIEGKPKFTGWENFGNENLIALEMDWIPNSNILDNFPKMKYCRIHRIDEEKDAHYDWDQEEYEIPFALVTPTITVD